ncbi:NAD(P)-dependent oxidoreductase [Alteribacter aurantiacus]|uniref:NAD(P)-dependent oxidoreductase n=1 Tax=Alteribacter aurantiacus TaxID=254410 RepID=UPI00041ED452|nr:NAD(P)H-binding protein [Alteribacter aurantiacus]
MNILLLGATGRVGSHLLKIAENDTHTYTLFVRSPEKLPSPLPPNMGVFKGDATDRRDLQQALKGQDGIISCLSTDKNNVLSIFTPLLVEEAGKKQIQRVVTVGTAGILQSRAEPDTYRFLSSESKRKTTTAAQDHLEAYQSLAKSDLDWTIVCPTFLPDGEKTGQIRFEEDVLPENGKRVTSGDTAAFTYDVFFKNLFIQKRVGLSE